MSNFQHHDDDTCPHLVRASLLEAENARLKAEVERLRKAGDELHHFLIGYIVEMRVSSSYLNKLDDDWTAAKEGKPTEQK